MNAEISSPHRTRFKWSSLTVSVLCAFLFFGCGRSSSHAPTAIRTAAAETAVIASKLPIYEIRIGSRDLNTLENAAFSNQTYPITFFSDGVAYENATARARGAWARSWPKKALKIFFPKNHPFQGQHCINLNSGWRDPAFVREPLAYYIYAACGAPAPKAQMVRLNVNGQFHGVYVEVEQPVKSFLERYNLKGASVYKANSHSNVADERDLGSAQSFAMHYEKETGQKEDCADLQRFCHELATAPNVLDFFNREVDLEKYINYLAATVLIQHWDGFNKNHFLVHDTRGAGKWFPVPWDLDRTLGDHWNWSFSEARLPILLGTERSRGITGWNRLEDRFFSDPTLTARFLDRLEELLQTQFTSDKLFPVLDQLAEQIDTDARLDYRQWPRQSSDFHQGIAEVKRFIQQRRAYLLAEIPKLRKR
jgi:spore coat protein H